MKWNQIVIFFIAASMLIFIDGHGMVLVRLHA